MGKVFGIGQGLGVFGFGFCLIGIWGLHGMDLGLEVIVVMHHSTWNLGRRD
jgi:hypothetical protein